MLGFIKTFVQYPDKFNLDLFCSCPVKLQEDLNLKFISKHNRGFVNHGCGCLDCAILKHFYKFEVTKVHEARESQLLIQSLQNKIFERFKIFKNKTKLNTAAGLINSRISN